MEKSRVQEAFSAAAIGDADALAECFKQHGDPFTLIRSTDDDPSTLSDCDTPESTIATLNADGASFLLLHVAAERGHSACVEFLLGCPGEPNPATAVSLSTPLHLAAWHGHNRVCAALLEACDDNDSNAVLCLDVDGRTALCLARLGKHRKVVKLLKNWLEEKLHLNPPPPPTYRLYHHRQQNPNNTSNDTLNKNINTPGSSSLMPLATCTVTSTLTLAVGVRATPRSFQICTPRQLAAKLFRDTSTEEVDRARCRKSGGGGGKKNSTGSLPLSWVKIKVSEAPPLSAREWGDDEEDEDDDLTVDGSPPIRRAAPTSVMAEKKDVESSSSKPCRLVMVRPLDFPVTIRGLKPGTEYRVAIAGVNCLGAGQYGKSRSRSNSGKGETGVVVGEDDEDSDNDAGGGDDGDGVGIDNKEEEPDHSTTTDSSNFMVVRTPHLLAAFVKRCLFKLGALASSSSTLPHQAPLNLLGRGATAGARATGGAGTTHPGSKQFLQQQQQQQLKQQKWKHPQQGKKDRGGGGAPTITQDQLQLLLPWPSMVPLSAPSPFAGLSSSSSSEQSHHHRTIGVAGSAYSWSPPEASSSSSSHRQPSLPSVLLSRLIPHLQRCFNKLSFVSSSSSSSSTHLDHHHHNRGVPRPSSHTEEEEASKDHRLCMVPCDDLVSFLLPLFQQTSSRGGCASPDFVLETRKKEKEKEKEARGQLTANTNRHRDSRKKENQQQQPSADDTMMTSGDTRAKMAKMVAVLGPRELMEQVACQLLAIARHCTDDEKEGEENAKMTVLKTRKRGGRCNNEGVACSDGGSGVADGPTPVPSAAASSSPSSSFFSAVEALVSAEEAVVGFWLLATRYELSKTMQQSLSASSSSRSLRMQLQQQQQQQQPNNSSPPPPPSEKMANKERGGGGRKISSNRSRRSRLSSHVNAVQILLERVTANATGTAITAANPAAAGPSSSSSSSFAAVAAVSATRSSMDDISPTPAVILTAGNRSEDGPDEKGFLAATTKAKEMEEEDEEEGGFEDEEAAAAAEVDDDLNNLSLALSELAMETAMGGAEMSLILGSNAPDEGDFDFDGNNDGLQGMEFKEGDFSFEDNTDDDDGSSFRRSRGGLGIAGGCTAFLSTLREEDGREGGGGGGGGSADASPSSSSLLLEKKSRGGGGGGGRGGGGGGEVSAVGMSEVEHFDMAMDELAFQAEEAAKLMTKSEDNTSKMPLCSQEEENLMAVPLVASTTAVAEVAADIGGRQEEPSVKSRGRAITGLGESLVAGEEPHSCEGVSSGTTLRFATELGRGRGGGEGEGEGASAAAEPEIGDID